MKLCIVICIMITSVYADRILLMTGVPVGSHKRTMMPIAKLMAERGHEVTIVSASKENNEYERITEIIPKDLARATAQIGHTAATGWKMANPVTAFPQLTPVLMNVCTAILDDPQVKEILDGKQKYDLAIFDMLYSECLLGIAGKLRIPFVYLSPNLAFVWVLNNLGIPSPTSYCPLHNLEFSDQMNFIERLQNFLYVTGALLVRDYYMMPKFQSHLENSLGTRLPPLREVEKNVSFILTNDHLLSSYPRPQMPNMVQIGGMHCKPASPLPKEMEEFIAGSGDAGFIFFSLGSVFPPSKMSDAQRKIFLDVFSELPQRILWKWDTDEMPGLPSNVRLYKWLPQQDLLGHPKCKAFISHGGLLSIQEATYHGVPILGIPGAADQYFNMHVLVNDGTGLSFKWDTLSKEDILEKLNTLMKNPSYRQRVKEKRDIYRDQLTTSNQAAVFWLDYVLRHKGAAHLRSAARHLNEIQLYQVDVFLFLLSVLLLVLYVVYRINKALYCLIKGKPKPAPTKKSKKSKRE